LKDGAEMKLNFDIKKLPCITEGGEGIIYEYDSTWQNCVIKQYKSHVDLMSKEKKIKLLISKKLPKEVVAPLDIVYDQNDNFLGYIMKKVKGNDFKKLVNKKFVMASNITTKDILQMLVSIQMVLNQLHDQDIYIGDLNDQNILFDDQLNVYFIDCDSWAIGSEKCDVVMDLFKDPLLVANDFNKNTDIYAFSILVWKTLTRIHPFGGVTDPDMDIMERMQRGISIINHPEIKIPRTIKPWNNLSPVLITALEKVFLNQSRILGDELKDMYDNLAFCDIDKEYYYNKFTTCPICDKNAKLQLKPICQGIQSGLTLIPLLNAKEIKLVINQSTYLDNNGDIVYIKTGRRTKYDGKKYYFDDDFVVITDSNCINILNGGHVVSKKYKSEIVVENGKIYYLKQNNSLVEMTLMSNGNSITPLCKCSNNAYFNVVNGKYFVFNYFDKKSIANVNGHNFTVECNDKIINYGIHYDEIGDCWLLILEDAKAHFHTFIFNEHEIMYKTDQIKYDCSLANVCICKKTLFIPIDGRIRGFSYSKNTFKDFECSIVDGNSKLYKEKNKFIIVNDENIYSLG